MIWGLFTTIPTTVPGRGVLTSGPTSDADLAATLFVSLDDGRQIQPGMPVQLDLASVKQEQSGFLLGTVTTVNELPSSQEEMLRVVGNDVFVQTLAAAGQLVPVHVQFIRDPSSANGYRWSSVQGPPTKLRSGMVFQGTITVDEQRAINLVIP
jgi:HlyD family secretion protein